MINLREIDSFLVGDGIDRTSQWQALFQNPKVLGQKIVIPPGNYAIKDSLVTMLPGKRVSLVGDGITRTKFTLLNNVTNPIFQLRGSELYASPFGHLSHLTFDEIQFDGAGFTATWFDMRFVAYTYFNRCMFGNTVGSAIQGFSYWDSNFHECHFAALSNGIKLLPAGIGPQAYSWCNNITFETCRFEQINGTGIDLPSTTRKCRAFDCKFDMVGMCFNADGSMPNVLVGNQYTHCGAFIPPQVENSKLKQCCNITD